MNSGAGITEGLLFGVACFLFLCPAVWLGFRVAQGDLESGQATVAYAPLLLCWLGIFITLHTHPVLALLLFLLAVAWCAVVPVRILAVNARIKRDLIMEQFETIRAMVARNPQDSTNHFRLAELYEQLNHPREAYTEYCAAAELDRHNNRAFLRARELYEEITKRPLRTTGPPAPVAPPAPPPAPPTVPQTPAPDPLTVKTQAVAQEPLNASQHAALADELVRHGRLKDAAEEYRKALELEPGNERYRFNYQALGGTTPPDDVTREVDTD